MTQLPPLPPFAGGFYFSIFLTQSGEIYGAGQNNYGQIFSKEVHTTELVKRDFKPCADIVRFKQLSACYDTTMALSVDGDAYAWGDNSFVFLLFPFFFLCTFVFIMSHVN